MLTMMLMLMMLMMMRKTQVPIFLSDTAMVIPTVNCIDWSAYGLARAHFDMYAASD